jgi:hypothetical protein
MNIIIGILAIIGVSYLIYLLMAYLMLPSQIMRIGPDSISLTAPPGGTQIINSEQLKSAWTSTSGSTLVFYINPVINDRTGQSGNEYANIVQIGSSQLFKILVAPDAGRGLSMAPALLTINIAKTSTTSSQAPAPEIVEIPKFPLQRWTGVAIVRQGRKFNIYLNGKLAVSHMCNTMTEFDSNQPLRVGDPRLGGTIEQMSLAPYALEAKDVRELYRATVDTSGKPIKAIELSVVLHHLLPNVSGFPGLPNNWWCPGGKCSSTQGISPLEQWTSPYG